jgi:hypothetical protein
MSLFTKEELESPLCIKVINYEPNSPLGIHFEFFGRVTRSAMSDIWECLSPEEKAIVEKDVVTGQDLFNTLEIIFRTWSELHPPKSNTHGGSVIRPGEVWHLYDPSKREPGKLKGICQSCGADLGNIPNVKFLDTLEFAKTNLPTCAKPVDNPKNGE